MIIRRFKDTDAKKVSNLIIETMKKSNSSDYPKKLLEDFIKEQTPEKITEWAKWTHFYVVEDNNKIIGCGAIGAYWGKEDESSLFKIFIHPKYQGMGIGRMIVLKLEDDEFAKRANRIEVPASITAVEFYKKMGYNFKNNNCDVDNEVLYRLEKRK